ncbi:MAG: tyrosine-type recombinase/integrase [Syntrophales bacterium]|nr:tyrosine-type recombinase/integrase [Syntrophales bacterium]MDD5640568.1 tyrosine-type recombinase/integrase [Syntrophales bacterium]
MAILAECPLCHRKQAVKNRICAGCDNDLVKLKRAGKVHYWVTYRLANGKQRKEMVKVKAPDGRLIPGGIEEARAAEGKKKAQKVENPTLLERVPAERMTFTQLADWYLDLKPVKKLASYNRIKQGIANFNRIFGERIVSSLKPLDLEDYQAKREEEGRAPATIDMEISLVKTMITKAFDNDLVDGRTVKAFRPIKRKLRKAANARRRTVAIEEYLKLVEAAAPHLKPIITVAFNTGMRTGELRALRRSHIDREKGVIRLPADVTKESRDKVIPMNHHVKAVLAELPRTIHHDFVFTYQNEPIKSPGGLHNSFLTACKKAGVPHGQEHPEGIIFHDIRRTVKTNMLSAGVDKVYRDTILGHSLQGMDAHYISPSEDDLHQAMARYTEWLDGQIKESVSQLGNLGNTWATTTQK